MRLYSVDQSGTHDILKKKHSNFHFNNKVSFNNQLLNCKIAVSDTNQTTYLQSLALNIPTIVYWNPDSTEVSEKSKPYLFELSKASILHYSPTSASNFLNDNYENIYDWWKSDIVQKARKNFINNYAKTCKDWDKSWFAFFKKINEFV